MTIGPAATVLVMSFLLLCESATAATTTKKKTKVPARPQIAVLALEGLAPGADKIAVEGELRSLLPSAEYVIQAADKTAATLDAVKKLGLACDSGDVDCLIRVGALTGATIVLKGLMSADGDAFALDLVAVDVNGLRERGRVRVKVPAEGDGRRLALESAVVGVLRPEAWRGQLKIAVSQRGADVVVDGVPRGFTPLSGPIDLTPGPHAVFVGVEGFAPWKGSVDVVYADEVVVDVVLKPGVAEEAPTFSTKPVPSPPEPLPATPARKGPMRVIVYDVEAKGVEPRVATVIGSFLVAELRKREQVSVLDSSELRALVGDGTSTAGDVRGCSEDQCFAEVAEALGADAVVVASLTSIEGQTLFGLRRIDQQKQEVTGSVVERVPAADTAALLPLVGKSIEATFADVPLRAGQKAGVDDTAALVLNPPPVASWITSSLGLGAAVAGAVGVVGGAGAVSVWLDYARRLDDGDTNDELAPSRATFDGLQVAGFVGLGAGLALGTAAAAVAPFTDWQGYGTVAAGGAP